MKLRALASGKHSIRRSDRLWAGLSSDLVIEQTLMKSVKSRGGLTRGRGMHKTVRHVWTTTMNWFSTIDYAMTKLTGVHDNAGDHVEVGAARKVQLFFTDNNPF